MLRKLTILLLYDVDEGGLNDSGEEVLTLPEAEKRELELQFGSSVIQFSSLTVDIDNCLGQGMHISY